jgi:thiamine-monophosphate kinase
MKHLGYKAVTVNLSDIYAMNGTPTQITVSIGVSSRFSLEAIEELYTGIQLACEAYGVDLVGGDTSTSQQGLVISITAVGVGDKDKIVYRSGAKEHDLICVSGDLGSAYIGLQFLEREKRIFLENPGVQPDLAGKDYVLERQLKPEARKDIIEWLAKEEIIPTSMIDISDGLSSELIHIATQSKVGVTVYEDKFPIDPVTYNNAFEIGLEPTLCALNGGEDYELLFTVSQKYFEKIKSNTAISIIGHCTATNEGLYMQSKSDQRHVLVAQGWKHLG